MDALEPQDRHQLPDDASDDRSVWAPAAARAAARRVAAARFVRSARDPGVDAVDVGARPFERAARRVDPVGVPIAPSAPPISVHLGPVRMAGAAPGFGSMPRRIAAAPGLSPAGRRWHHEQKCVERAPMTIRRTVCPQRKHGSPARW
jgi:hypothetical protein